MNTFVGVPQPDSPHKPLLNLVNSVHIGAGASLFISAARTLASAGGSPNKQPRGHRGQGRTVGPLPTIACFLFRCPGRCFTDEKIAKFVETMRSNVLTGDTPFRRAYIRSVIDQVRSRRRRNPHLGPQERPRTARCCRRRRSDRSAQFCSEVAPDRIRTWPSPSEVEVYVLPWTGSSSSIETRASSDGKSESYSRPQPQRR